MSMAFILKLILVPLLIAGVTMAGRRWGAAVAGWLSAFPVVSGPILLFMALEQGPAFTAQAAMGTLSAVLAILAFGIAYAWAAIRHHWAVSLMAGFLGYAAAVAGLSLWTPPLWLAASAVAAALLLAPRLYPSLPPSRPALAQSFMDIPLRMVAGALLVWLVTHFAARMGPHLSGIFAMFPVMGSVLTVFSHRQSGAAFAIGMLRGMVLGYYAFAAFCVMLALALPTSIGTLPAFMLALASAVAIQALSRSALQASAAPLTHISNRVTP
jgi:hypothetical protein